MYVLKDIKQLADAIEKNEIVVMGKLLKFKAEESVFTSEDQKLIQYILEYNKMLKYTEQFRQGAPYIKNSSTQNASGLKELQGEIKFALTGTPIENSIADLW